MPNLGYKYIMNEPFVNGTADQYCSSRDVNAFKLEVKYEGLEGLAKKDQEKCKGELYSSLKAEPKKADLAKMHEVLQRPFKLYLGPVVAGEFKRSVIQQQVQLLYDINCRTHFSTVLEVQELIKVQQISDLSIWLKERLVLGLEMIELSHKFSLKD